MVATTREERDADFSAYLAARQPALLRTAYLLTGNRSDAEDLLQVSLAKLYLAWDRVRTREAVDAYVRRIMVNEYNSLWRRAWKRRERVVDEVPRGRRTPIGTTTAGTSPSGPLCGRCRPGSVRSWCCATTRT
ncbi:MAG: sigma factor [Nocardioides sp.]